MKGQLVGHYAVFKLQLAVSARSLEGYIGII